MADDPRRESGRNPKTTGGSDKNEFQEENEQVERGLGGQPRTGGTERESGGSRSGETGTGNIDKSRESGQGGRTGTGNTGTDRQSGTGGGSTRQASPGRSGESRTSGMDREESDIGKSGDVGGGRSRPGQKRSHEE
jgi:hypothetical protein